MITFEVFSRCVALLLEENAEKVSTSSQQNYQEDMQEYEEMYGQEGEEMYEDDGGYYNETGELYQQ